MSLSSKKTKTRETVTPTNPAWVEPQLSSLAGRITDLSQADPQSFVAGPNSLQSQAYQGAQSLAPDEGSYGSARGLFQALMDTPAPQVKAATGTASSLLPNIDAYMSPYLQDVVDTSLSDYDYGAGQTRAQNLLALANDNTFGGSGGSIQTALSEDALARGRGALSSKLYDQGFQTGANLANLDADRAQQMALANMAALNAARQFNATAVETGLGRQQAAGRDLVDTASSLHDASLADVNAQSQIGELIRQIAQQQAQAPLSTLSTLAGAYQQLPLSLLNGRITEGATKETGSVLDAIGQMVDIASGVKGLMKKG